MDDHHHSFIDADEVHLAVVREFINRTCQFVMSFSKGLTSASLK